MIASPNRYNPWHLLQLANAFAPCADQFPLFQSADEIKGIKGLGHFQRQESGRASLIAASSTCCTEWMHLHVPGSVSRQAYLAITVYCVPCVHQSGKPEAFLHFCALSFHVAPLNLFPVCVGICHAKAISAPCLIAVSFVPTGDFVMQCTW